jgi:hypothetical protein
MPPAGTPMQVWRRCNNCGRIWCGSKTRKSCTNHIGGIRFHCGSGRLIRYPDQDAEVQSIINARTVIE